jgi:tRNA(Ile)-lysidine synthase
VAFPDRGRPARTEREAAKKQLQQEKPARLRALRARRPRSDNPHFLRLTRSEVRLTISPLKTGTAKTKTPTTRTRLSGFARQLLSAWRQAGFSTSDASAVVAVSGGADSTALLLGLDELRQAGKISAKLIVAHLDHSLRQSSKKDAAAVKALATELGYDVITRRIDVKKRAAKNGDNLEQAARRIRYDFLKATATKHRAELILTGHTLDDQAETVLLRLLRGSAAEGLGGMEMVRFLEKGSPIRVGRPLVSWARRVDVENYCRWRQVEFCLDEMNEDEKFSRVRVRKQLLPLMQSFNSKIVEALSRTAGLLREDANALSDEAEKLLATAAKQSKGNLNADSALNVQLLAVAPAAVRRRALRLWLERERGDLRRLEMVHLVAIDRLLSGTQGGRVAQLPNGGLVRRKGGWLELSSTPASKKG